MMMIFDQYRLTWVGEVVYVIGVDVMNDVRQRCVAKQPTSSYDAPVVKV